ncbi:MAG: class I SAM-dependent methyltransferase [Candidatus Omnitrophota bacterium]
MNKHDKLIDAGMRVADLGMSEEDKTWSCYSSDKVDIGEELADIIRVLNKELPLKLKLTALSIGSSHEPQFRILETAFRGGLYLLDLDKQALNIVKERITRQHIGHVNLIQGDYNKIFLDDKNLKNFFQSKLKGRRMNLVILYHSLYYSPAAKWGIVFENIYRKILASHGAMHAVLMASKSNNQDSTAWLYNYFAGKFFGVRNNQDLYSFKAQLEKCKLFKNTKKVISTRKVFFYVDNFAKFMSVVWMILLYPSVHKYSFKQRKEITEYVYSKFWLKKKPLVQEQDHLIIYRGIKQNR